MTPFEFVIIFLMGGVIILSTVGNDRSETNSVIAVMTIGLLHRAVSALAVRYRLFGLIFEGMPIVVLNRGRWRMDIMNMMRLQPPDIMASARTKGVKTFDGIRYAVLERLGSISILKEKQK